MTENIKTLDFLDTIINVFLVKSLILILIIFILIKKIFLLF